MRFVVETAFTLSGRGTVVMGLIEPGVVRAGDQLKLLSPGGEGSVSCEGVALVRRSHYVPGEPFPVGLSLPELVPSDVSPGDVIVSG